MPLFGERNEIRHNLAEWVALGITLVVQLLSAVAFLVSVRRAQQELIVKRLSKIEEAIGIIQTDVAGSTVKQEESQRHLTRIEEKLEAMTEIHNFMRTQIMDLSGAVRRLDPKWKPYQER